MNGFEYLWITKLAEACDNAFVAGISASILATLWVWNKIRYK
jgi:hypothetical protein